MKLETKKEIFNSPLYLEGGRVLPKYELVYETYGRMNNDKSNIIIICHALTGSHHAAGLYEGEKKAGWWDKLIGDGKIIDTNKFFVICVNVLGSCYGSTSPLSVNGSKRYGLKFPVITVSDMVKAQMNLFQRLGIQEAYAIIGGSLGGMQALCFAIEYPNFSKRIIALACTYATSPWAIAFNKIASEAIINDPQFNNGNYDPKVLEKNGFLGLVLGRMAGHISFLSPQSMKEKFSRNYVETDGLYELFGRFQVEKYLKYNGSNFSKRFDPLSYLYIIKAMNIFDITRHYDTLKGALSEIKGKLFLISFSGDLLFLPSEMKKIKNILEDMGRGNLVSYFEINSSYGHDAFLVEYDKFDIYIRKALEN